MIFNSWSACIGDNELLPLGTAWSLMDMRSKKLLRRLISTPLRKPVFLFAHFIARSVLSGIEYLILILFSYFVFSVEVQGSILGLLFYFYAEILLLVE